MKKQFKNWLILVMLGIAIITGSGIMRGVEADKIDAKGSLHDRCRHWSGIVSTKC